MAPTLAPRRPEKGSLASGESMKRPHMGRRRLVILGIGAGFVLAGLFVLVDQAFVASVLNPLVGSTAGSTGVGFTPYGTASYVVYAIGLGLLGTGVGLLRMTFHSSISSYASGGSGMTGAGFSPEMMQGLMAQSQAAMASMASMNRSAVKVKCPKCGSLEEEDAKFCHRCGHGFLDADAAAPAK